MRWRVGLAMSNEVMLRVLVADLMKTSHEAASALSVRKMLLQDHLTEPLRAGLLAKTADDETVARRLLDAWERAALALAEERQ